MFPILYVHHAEHKVAEQVFQSSLYLIGEKTGSQLKFWSGQNLVTEPKIWSLFTDQKKKTRKKR